MKTLNLASAIKRYNGIMGELGYEHNQIGTRFSGNTENWNLRDMVAECDYTLSCYYEEGHSNGEMRYSEDEEERKMWKSETGKLERFVKAYKPFINNMTCFENHCSKYDNCDN
jgi:hypothetical protein